MRSVATGIFLLVNIMVFAALSDVGLGGSLLVLFPLTVILSFFAVLVHELGHAIVAHRFGADVKAICVMIFHFHVRTRKLTLVAPSHRGDIAGYVIYQFAGWWGSQRQDGLIAAAGPAANLALAIVTGTIATLIATPRANGLEMMLTALTIMSAGMAAANLVPFKGSDGATIWQTVRFLRRRPR